VPAVHVVAEQDDPLGAQQYGQIQRLIAAIAALVDAQRRRRQPRFVNARNPQEAEFVRRALVLRDL